MEKISNWESLEAKGMEDFKSLPIGAYECVIVGASIYKNLETGKESFKVEVDITNGEYKDYFKKRYESNTNKDKKWDNNAVRYLAFEGDNVSYFKGFITCVENSNKGYTWNWEEKSLIGKKICGVFQYEEYEKQDGSKALKVRLTKFRSLDKMKDIEVNDSVKLLNGSYISYKEYNEARNNQYVDFGNTIELTDDDLAF